MPLTRYWLIPSAQRPKVYTPHPLMSPDEIRQRTQAVWDRFYGLAAIWQRSVVRAVDPVAPRVRPALEALPADVRQHRHRDRQRACRAIGRAARAGSPESARRLFIAAPMPDLQEPPGAIVADAVPARPGS